MSLQELHIKALEQQVANLTRDCYYLLSLINTVDEIDWDNWEEGKRIKEDLTRSEEFAKVVEEKKKATSPQVKGYVREPELDEDELRKFRAARAQREQEIAQRYPRPHRIPRSPLDDLIATDSFPIELRDLFLGAGYRPEREF